MKKIVLFFFLFAFYNVGVYAQEQPSSLQIKMWDNSLFSAVFGGDDSGNFQRTYNVRSLAGGEYFLRIMQRAPGGGTVTLFEGHIEIPSASRVQAVLLESGKLEVSVLEDRPRAGANIDLRNRMQGAFTQRGGRNVGARADTRAQLIEPLGFTYLHNSMSNARNDQMRDSIAVAGLQQYLFTTAYVLQMARLFRNENSRLEFAKSAYTRVVDPENYFQMKTLFEQRENIESLELHMQQQEGATHRREFQGLF